MREDCDGAVARALDRRTAAKASSSVADPPAQVLENRLAALARLDVPALRST